MSDPAPSETYSLSEEFKVWKAAGPHAESWSEKRTREWTEHIDLYLSRGWVLIPCQHRQKWPDKGANWKTMKFSGELLKWHVTHGGNVAINAGESGLVICDYDSKFLPARLMEMIGTMPVVTTPKGFAFFTKAPVDESLANALFSAYPAFDVPRAEGMYEVVPLSETCKFDTRGAHKVPDSDHVHDFRVRRWIGGPKSILLNTPPFMDFVRTLTQRWNTVE